jgi:S1-C subfamily serine protease
VSLRVDRTDGGETVVVSAVAPGSAAERSGLRAGDRLLTASSEDVPSIDAARALLEQARAEGRLRVRRDARVRTLRVPAPEAAVR